MPTSQVTYLGNLRTQAIHLASKSELTTDAPKDNHGKGDRFSPTDLLATSLASCMITLMGIKSHQQGFELGQVNAKVQKLMSPTPRRVGKIQIDFDFPDSDYSDKQKNLLKEAALNCPVALSLHPDLNQVIRFNF
jgi:uncharacterized OsmC-like protein